jgi:capsid protein
MSRRTAKSALPDLSRSGAERPFPGGKAQASAGFGGSIAFRETIFGGPDRTNVLFLVPSDSRFYLGGYTRIRIDQKVQWLWQNFGIVKEAGAGIARHSIGKGLSLVIDSEDHEFAQAAEADFEDFACAPSRCDLAGRRDFYKAQNFLVQQRIIRGEGFAVHSDNPRWKDAPCFQLFDPREITSPDNAGDDVVDGVKVGKFNEAVEYYASTIDGKTTPIPAEKMMHWFEAFTAGQVRGISDLAQSADNLVDFHELRRLATRSAKSQQLVALVLKGIAKKKTRGAFGSISKAGSADPNVSNSDTADMERIYGGAGAGIAYLDEDGDAKLITPNTPAPNLEQWITNVLMPDACASWGLPVEFWWAVAKLNSANVRFILAKADLFFTVLADELAGHFCTPVAFRYISSRIAKGILPKPKKPWRCTWQGPRRTTIDNGRDGNTKLQFLASGATTLKKMYNEDGENWLPHTRQWFREFATAKRIAAEEGVPEAFGMWRALMPGAGTPEPTAQDHDDEDAKTEQDDDKKQPGAPSKKTDEKEEPKPEPKKKKPATKR